MALTDGYLPLADAARQKGVTPATLRLALKQGRLEGEKHAGRWFVRLEEVDRYQPVREPPRAYRFQKKARPGTGVDT